MHAHLEVIDILEQNAVLTSLSPFGEPMLGRRNLYPNLGGAIRTKTASGRDGELVSQMLWAMFLADGRHTLLDLAERVEAPFGEVAAVARELASEGLLHLELTGGKAA